MQELTHDIVMRIFEYVDGHLYWKDVNHNIMVENGDAAGFLRKDGYEQIKVNGKPYLAHRLIFLYHHGYMPEQIDHTDRNRSNNLIENLRESTSGQNRMNTVPRNGNNGSKKSSQYTGVAWRKDRRKWIAYINVHGHRAHLGFFHNEDNAARAYNNAAKDLHEEFAYLNIINGE